MNSAADTLRETIKEFIESQRIDRGSSEKTIEAYRADLEQFAEWLSPGTLLEQVDRDTVGRFLGSRSRAGNRPSSIARKASALRQFFKFCALEKKIARSPAEGMETPSIPKKLPKHRTPEIVQILLDAADAGIPYRISNAKQLAALQARDAAMIYLLYASGLRVSELVGLKVGDVDIEQGYVRVRGKGDKQRLSPFAPVAGERLHRYITGHRTRLMSEKSTQDALFLNRGGEAMTRQWFWQSLKTLAAQAGVDGPITPHVLRHSFAIHLLNSGMNLRSLQLLLGHSDLSTTQIYTGTSLGHLKSAHRKYHPRGGG